MTEFRKLEDGVLVAGQLSEADLEEAARLGVKVVINNRPDDEVPGQPRSSDLEAKARELGMEYAYVPIVSGRVTQEQIEEFGLALGETGEESGNVLAFCRTGNRSTCMWGLARARAGGDPEDLVSAAAAAGYDISGLLSLMEDLAREA